MESIHRVEFPSSSSYVSVLYKETLVLKRCSRNLMVLVDCAVNPITKDIFFYVISKNDKIILLSEIGSKHMTKDNLVIRRQ